MLPEVARKFMRASKSVQRNMIRCGFELETQWSEGGDPELDEEAYYERISEMASDAMGEDIREALSRRAHRSTLDAVYEALREYYEQDDHIREDYMSSGKPEAPCSTVAVGTDGSVNGWEFRTKGALTYREFMSAAESVFDIDHTIDTGCSFHIHLSIPGVEHKYGINMQRAIAEFFALNISRLPKSVQERLKRTETNSYINHLTGKEQKYCFLRFHPQGTWEFRCIGNVHNTDDARACLDFCIEALAYAYRVIAGEERLYWRVAVSEFTWNRAIYDALAFKNYTGLVDAMLRYAA